MSEKDWLIALWVGLIAISFSFDRQFNQTKELIKEVKMDCSKRK